jgi:Fe-S oxidoreductase
LRHGPVRIPSEALAESRTLQLIDTGATTVASACPFCMTMLSDGLEAKDREDIRQLDVVELLAESCGAGEAATPAAAE